MIRLVRLQDVPATFYVGPAGIVVASELPEVAEIEAGKVWEQSGGKLAPIPAVLGDGPGSDLQSFTDEATIKDYLYARQILSDQEVQMVASWLRNRTAPVPEIGKQKEPDVQTRVEKIPVPEKPSSGVEYLAGPAGLVVLGEDAQEAYEVARQIREQFNRKLSPVPAVLGQYSSVDGVRAFLDKVAVAEYLNGADLLNQKEITAVLNWLKDRSKPVPVISEKKKKPPAAEVKQTPPPDKAKAEPASPSDNKGIRLVVGPGGVILFGHDIAEVQAAAKRLYLQAAGSFVPIPAIKGKRSPAPDVMAFPDIEAAKKYTEENRVFSSEELHILKHWAQTSGSPVPILARRPAAQAATVTTTALLPRPYSSTRSRWNRGSQVLFWAMLAPFAVQLGVLLFLTVAEENVVLGAWFLAAFIRFWAFFARDAGSPVYWRWPFLIGGGAVDLWLGLYLLAPERLPHPWSDWQVDSIFAAILLTMAAISVIRGIWGIIPDNRVRSLS